MASLYVRETVRDWLANSAGMLLPFYDTINLEVAPEVPAWSTVTFVTSSALVSSYCWQMQERGTFDFLALALPGNGDADLLAAAEHDLAILMAQLDLSGALTLLQAGPPDDFVQAAGVPWYTVSMTVDYVYMQPLA